MNRDTHHVLEFANKVVESDIKKLAAAIASDRLVNAHWLSAVFADLSDQINREARRGNPDAV